MVAQEGRAQVLDGVALRRVHAGLVIGGGEAQVERGDRHTTRRVTINAAHVDARLKQKVVDGEARDALHVTVLSHVALDRRRYGVPAFRRSGVPAFRRLSYVSVTQLTRASDST